MATKFKVSKTHIKKKTAKKTNLVLVETIKEARKNPAWFRLSHILSGPTRIQTSINLSQLDKDSKAGDTIIIPGKVLSQGELTKKLRLCALSFSAKALENMKKTKSEAVSILEEIKKNPKAEGIKIAR
ncbi:MAG: 50S ribosomal protein L18e [Candidatus Nanoarchaeia archaeon]|nr:50S ribosomal protein L18e [Candidatus Nanoarchaeia archaeon]